jgi:putative transposase
MKLSGIPGSVKNIIAKASRESWACRKREGKGGGLEYELTSLPPETVTSIKDRLVKSIIAAPVVALPPTTASSWNWL